MKGFCLVPCEPRRPIPREHFVQIHRHLVALAFRQLAAVLGPPLAAALSIRAVAVRSRRPADAAAKTELERFPVAMAGANPAEAGFSTNTVEAYIAAGYSIAYCAWVGGHLSDDIPDPHTPLNYGKPYPRGGHRYPYSGGEGGSTQLEICYVWVYTSRPATTSSRSINNIADESTPL